MKTLLIKPPFSEPSMPSLSIPALTAFCRQAGLDIDIYDLDIEVFEYFMSVSTLEKALSKIDGILSKGQYVKQDSCTVNAKKALAIGPHIKRLLPRSLKLFRTRDAFYEYPGYRSALTVLNGVMEILCAAYYPTYISFGDYRLPGGHTIARIKTHITDEDSNPFLSYYREIAIPQISRQRLDLIAISITFQSQFLPTLTLLNALRSRLSHIPVVIGGAYLTSLADRLPRIASLLKGVTGVVFFEGETALVQIIEHLKKGSDIARIPNVVRVNDIVQGLMLSKPQHIERFSELPPPDFDGMPLEKYLLPELVLPLQSCRGCYWERCAFCSTSISTSGRFRSKTVNAVVSELDHLHQKYGCVHFRICDDATTHAMLDGLADHIIEGKLPYHWSTEVRFDGRIDEAFCKKLAKGGCSHLLFGFESSSDDILHLMNKGTSIALARRNLASLKKAQIAVNLQAFVGFPGETETTAEGTLDFFLSEHDLFSSVALASFSAVYGCKVVQNPSAFGVTLLPVEDSDDAEIECRYRYKVDHGLGPQEAAEFAERALKRLAGADVLGPGLLHGTCGSHGQLCAAALGRDRVDALGTDNFRWVWDIEKNIFTVPPSVEVLRLSDDAHILIETTKGFYSLVNGLTNYACNQIRLTPKKLTEVAVHSLKAFDYLHTDEITTLAEIISNLIHLARRGIVVPLASQRDRALRLQGCSKVNQ